MNKCDICGKETSYKSPSLKFLSITNYDTNKEIKCLCKDCENIMTNYLKSFNWKKE